jgi:hypothetical protein
MHDSIRRNRWDRQSGIPCHALQKDRL